MPRTVLPAIVLAVLVAVTVHGEGPPPPVPHIRIVDHELQQLFQTGLLVSPTLRALVHRLESSDVVAYVRLEETRDGIDGSLQFVSASAGTRYLLIRVVRMPPRRQLALMAHELQHAVEVASAAHVVDEQTFTHYYERIGHANRYRRHRTRSFETLAAMITGDRVRKELDGRDLGKRRRPLAEMAALTMMAPGVQPED